MKKILVLLAVIAIAGFVGAWIGSRQVARATGASVQRWEYADVPVQGVLMPSTNECFAGPLAATDLNKVGNVGWELAYVYTERAGLGKCYEHWILKRPI